MLNFTLKILAGKREKEQTCRRNSGDFTCSVFVGFPEILDLEENCEKESLHMPFN